MKDVEKKWQELTQKCVTKLNQNHQDWQQLSDEEQELAALWKLEADLYNGGFVQFFCNWGFDCYRFALRCLKKIGANEAYKILKQQYKIIQRFQEDSRVKELWDLPRLLTESEANDLNELDQKYWENKDDIPEKTLKIYGHL